MSQRLDEFLPPGYARRYLSATGGCVDVHDTHGKLEIRQNLPIAVFLADRGERVCLLQVYDIPHMKSPDATRDGIEWEFKCLERATANAVDTALRNASKQADRVMLVLQPNFDLKLLEQAIFDRLRRAANVAEIAVLFNENLFHFSRTEVLQNSFRGKMG